MNLADVMDAVSDQLDTITGLRCFPYPAPKVTPPAAVVSYPEAVNFDATYGRGMDRMSLVVWLLVGRVSERSARDQLGAYCDGSGSRSVKAVLESGTYTAFDEVRVESIEFDVIKIGDIDYIAAGFTLDIAGSGA